MPWPPIESLKPELARSESLFTRGLITAHEAGGRVLDACIFTLVSHPEAWQPIADALVNVPVPMLTEAASQLGRMQLPDGGWEWPPVGAIGNPGGVTVPCPASPAEAAASETLLNALRELVNCAERPGG
jgi:hypothetical protein